MKIKLTVLTILIGIAFFLFPAPEAKAIDPVTMAILAPIALKLAEKAQPYVLRGLKGGVKGLINCGKDLIDLMRLPLGLIQSTLGIPFGALSMGVKNIVLGAIAPFKLCWHVLILPVYFLGVNVGK